MRCSAFGDLLHAYLDGELDPARGAQVEGHLAYCPACARSCAELKALSGALRSLVLPLAVPAGLRAAVLSSLGPVGAPPVRWPQWARSTLPLAASVACLLSAALLAAWQLLTPAAAPQRPVMQEAIASHVRSLAGDSSLEVQATSGKVLQQWFGERMSFRPIIPDPPEAGDALVGGHMANLDGQPAAAVVYRRGSHRITLLTWPRTSGIVPLGPLVEQRAAYSVAHWVQGSMVYWVVSDLPPPEMLRFVQKLRLVPAAPST
jgi:anti-sigma factor RsiW